MSVEADSTTATNPTATPAPDSGAAPSAPAPSPSPEATPATTTPPAETTASPGEPIDVRKGLLEAATAAIQKASGPPSAPGQETAGAKPDSTAKPIDAAAKVKPDAAAKAAEEDDTKPPPFNDHPRWKKLTRDYEKAGAEIK